MLMVQVPLAGMMKVWQETPGTGICTTKSDEVLLGMGTMLVTISLVAELLVKVKVTGAELCPTMTLPKSCGLA